MGVQSSVLGHFFDVDVHSNQPKIGGVCSPAAHASDGLGQGVRFGKSMESRKCANHEREEKKCSVVRYAGKRQKKSGRIISRPKRPKIDKTKIMSWHE